LEHDQWLSHFDVNCRSGWLIAVKAERRAAAARVNDAAMLFVRR